MIRILRTYPYSVAWVSTVVAATLAVWLILRLTD